MRSWSSPRCVTGSGTERVSSFSVSGARPGIVALMQADGLFDLNPPASGPQGFVTPSADSPLAVRMRPLGLDELVGQDHLLAPGAPLRRVVAGGAPMSVILW